MSRSPIRVVIADDSPFIRRLLGSYFTPEAGFTVVGEAADGLQAIDAVHRLRPDVLTLDLEMPEMDGLEALGEIMRTQPTPVVAISGVSGKAATRTLQALDLGAVDFVLKFSPGVEMDPATLAREIVTKARLSAGIHVVRLLDRARETAARKAAQGSRGTAKPYSGLLPGIVIIGASTGGPTALRELLGELPADFPAPIVVIQHIPAFFTGVLASQLNRYCQLQVREAEQGDRLEPGSVFVAPGGSQLLLRTGLRIELQDGSGQPGEHCPSIDVTMESAARLLGARTTGVLLSGLGVDGAAGLLAIRRHGGRTFAQDEDTSAVFGMPKRAIELGAAASVDNPAGIGAALSRLFPAEVGVAYAG
jgi:two-component system chemotaxis response regulator CheB